MLIKLISIQTASFWLPVRFLHNMTLLLAAAKDGTLHLSTDKSFRRKSGGAAWILSSTSLEYTDDRHTLEIQGTRLSPGALLHLYRTEIFGIYCGSLIVHSLHSYANIPPSSVIIVCNNEKTLNVSQDLSKKITPSCSNFDLLSAIRSIKIQHTAIYVPEHVDFHLDLKGQKENFIF